MDKKAVSETDIRSKFITPAIAGEGSAGWDLMTQIREEVYFTNGRVIVGGKTVKRGEAKKADYILYHRLNIPSAAEQQRIVALVDQLEAQLEQSRSTATNLLTALVAELTQKS